MAPPEQFAGIKAGTCSHKRDDVASTWNSSSFVEVETKSQADTREQAEIAHHAVELRLATAATAPVRRRKAGKTRSDARARNECRRPPDSALSREQVLEQQTIGDPARGTVLGQMSM